MSGRLPELAAGVYQHYKGPLYLVLGYAHDANDAERVAVVYVGLELDGAKTGPRLAVRDAAEFLGYVHPDGSGCPGAAPRSQRRAEEGCDQNELLHGRINLRVWEERHRRRFRYLGPSWEGQRA